MSNKGEFLLPDGRIIKIKPVSTARLRAAENKARKELQAKGFEVDPPTYVPIIPNLAPGAVVDPVPYTKETIQDAPQEVRVRFDEYLRTQDQITKLAVAYMLTTLILRGTEFTPENGWESAQLKDGMEIPEDPDEKYVHYMLTEVLIPPSVAEACSKEIVLLSLEGAPEEVIEAFEASFRHPVQVKGRSDSAGDQGGAG